MVKRADRSFQQDISVKNVTLMYQKPLKNQLKESKLLFFNLMINALQDLKEVSLKKNSKHLTFTPSI